MRGHRRRGFGVALVAALLLPIFSAAAERITFAEVRSEALGRSLPVTIVAPATVSANGDTPVLFFLHGRGRNHRSLIDSPMAREALLGAPFFVVLPQGEDGWYLDSPARPADRYGRYTEEVIAWAEKNLPISRTPGRTGIAGWSMGGYGAVHFAQLHPGRFGFVASVIGLLDFPRAATLPEGQNYKVPEARFTADAAVWARLNPMHGLPALRGSAVTLVLATRGFERTMNENFIAACAATGLPAPRLHWLEGGHEFPVVERAIPLVLADAADSFQKALVATPEPRATATRP